MARFVQYTGRIFVPALVMAELYVWAYMRPDPTEFLSAITAFLDYDVDIMGFDEASAEQFGRLRVRMQSIGVTMTPIDMLNASVALAHDMTLVTHNTADFQNVPNLNLDDWLRSCLMRLDLTHRRAVNRTAMIERGGIDNLDSRGRFLEPRVDAHLARSFQARTPLHSLRIPQP